MSVSFEDPNALLAFDTSRLEEVSLRVLKENCSPALEVTVVFVDDDFIADLNRRFLGTDAPTDVLAFDLGHTPPSTTAVGEVYVSVERAREQARAYRVPPEEEVLRLVVHGLLHLSGCDDRTASGRRLMHERTEAYLKAAPEQHIVQ